MGQLGRSILAMTILVFAGFGHLSAYGLTPEATSLPTNTNTWYVSGYLPESPDNKVWVRIKNSRITAVHKIKPKTSSLIIDTNDWLFPGLVDLHNHLIYNILPLWKEAKGQFNSRYEWRSKYPPYERMKKRIRPFKQDPCAPLRWAELKAVVSGVTAITGVGSLTGWDCARNFGPLNIEIPGEISQNRGIKNSFEVLQPALVGNVYLRHLYPRIQSGLTYDQAYSQFAAEQGFDRWVRDFVNQPHNLAVAAILTLGPEKGAMLAELIAAQPITDELQLQEFLGQTLAETPFSFKARQITNWLAWIYGDSRKDGFLKAPQDEDTAWRYIGENGVFSLSRVERKYAGTMEQTRRNIIARLLASDALPFITHLSEGHPDDEYTKHEYSYYQGMDLAQPGTILVHGVGMNEQDFEHAAANGISLVWSPFSNLLLYGKTMDIELALKKGVNVALGADWSPTGSKSLLDEMRLAWEYIRSKGLQIPAKAIADMITVNAARAIGLDDYGMIKRGQWANLTLVRRREQPLYDAETWSGYHDLVTSYQRDVQLVIIAGHPMFGETAHIQQAQEAFGSQDSIELLPFAGGQEGKPCRHQKALWVRQLSRPEVDTAAEIRQDLQTKIDEWFGPADTPNSNHWTLDPLFACEDSLYRQRYFDFVPLELPENEQLRPLRRKESGLKDDWHPFDLFVW